MTVGILVPLVALPIALFVAWRWYVHAVRRPPDAGTREISGVRLTAEALHRLPNPPWRVVHEIGDQLREIDHVVIGPPGVIAVHTRVGDRPPAERVAAGSTAALAADAAVIRGPLDELLVPVSMRTSALAHVFWGAADAERPAAEETIHATPYVEGQRLHEWLAALAATDAALLDAEHVDLAWRVVTMGIGRPDPLGPHR